jgi:hypothetical protein
LVADSPIAQLMMAIDGLDVESVMALFAPEPRLLTADGRRAEGSAAVRELIAEVLGTLRTATHRVTAEWHVDDVWIAEVEADFELQDWLQMRGLPRAIIVRTTTQGIAEARIYGAHEPRLEDHPTGEEGMWIGTRWIPPL